MLQNEVLSADVRNETLTESIDISLLIKYIGQEGLIKGEMGKCIPSLVCPTIPSSYSD